MIPLAFIVVRKWPSWLYPITNPEPHSLELSCPVLSCLSSTSPLLNRMLTAERSTPPRLSNSPAVGAVHPLHLSRCPSPPSTIRAPPPLSLQVQVRLADLPHPHPLRQWSGDPRHLSLLPPLNMDGHIDPLPHLPTLPPLLKPPPSSNGSLPPTANGTPPYPPSHAVHSTSDTHKGGPPLAPSSNGEAMQDVPPP